MNHNSEKNKEAISRKEIISFLVILIITVLVLIALPRIRQFHNHHIAELEKQKMQPVIQSVENIILPIAQEHGITDLTVSFIDKPYSVKVYCKSDSFLH